MRCSSPTKLSKTWRRAFSPRRRLLGTIEQRHQRVAERVEVVGIVEQHAGPRDHLVDDATNGRRHDRLGLPHAFGDGQAEAFGQALLHDDGGMTL